MIRILEARTATSSSGEKVEITQQDLHDIADNYSTDEPAPFVFGHPKTDGPAKGWVESLVVKGNALFAKGANYTKDLINGVKDRSFIKISSSLHKKDSTANPNPGFMSLKHVGFLGEETPAMPMGVVKPADLSADDDAVIYSFSDFDEEELNFNDEVKNMSGDVKNKPDEVSALQARFDALEEENTGLKENIKKLEQREGIRAARDFSDSVEDFCAEAIKGGHILPVQKKGLTALLEFANDASQSMDFSDGQTADPMKTIKGFVKELKQVDFSEKAGEDAGDALELSTVVSVDGHNVSKDDVAKLNKVKKLAVELDIPFNQAVIEAENRGEI